MKKLAIILILVFCSILFGDELGLSTAHKDKAKKAALEAEKIKWETEPVKEADAVLEKVNYWLSKVPKRVIDKKDTVTVYMVLRDLKEEIEKNKQAFAAKQVLRVATEIQKISPAQDPNDIVKEEK